MRFGNLTLIRILLQEYVDIVQTSGSFLLKQTSLDKLGDGFSSTSGNRGFGYESDDEDRDDSLAEIEDEILLLVAHQSGNKKRQRGIDISQNKTRKKCCKNSRKTLWTNPQTQEHEHYTWRDTRWYTNYVLNPRTDNDYWCKSFRKRFRTSHDGFLLLISLCRQSDIFSNWADVDSVHRYSRTKITPLALLVLL